MCVCVCSVPVAVNDPVPSSLYILQKAERNCSTGLRERSEKERGMEREKEIEVGREREQYREPEREREKWKRG